jgi:hypothetical protein
VHSIDGKKIQMPKSDCEVLLMGDCNSRQQQQQQQQNVLVTLKPASLGSETTNKTVKVILGNTRVELQYHTSTPSSWSMSSRSQQQNFKIKVNGQVQQLNSNGLCVIQGGGQSQQSEQSQEYPDQSQSFVERQQLGMMQQQQQYTNQPVAVVQCNKNKCALRSDRYGVYVSISGGKVQVDVDSTKTPFMCGMCSRHPELPRLPTDQAAVRVFKANEIQGDQQCRTSPTIEQARSEETCKRNRKYKVMHLFHNGEIMRCATENAVSVCNDKCTKRGSKNQPQNVVCVRSDQADELGMYPTMQSGEMEMSSNMVNKLMENMSKTTKMSVKMPVAISCE